MISGDVIKSFLVGLGFDVDETSLAKFNKAIANAALKITALYTSIQIAATGIFAGIAKIADGFEQMGYEYRLIAPAINKAIILRRELMKAYSAAGINIIKTVQQSILFNFSLTKTKYALEALYKSVGARFLPLLTKQMDVFRKQIYANMPKIQAFFEKFIKAVFKAFQVTVELGQRLWSVLGRVWEFLTRLDTATGGWSTKILAVVAAWKYLNLAFLATPLGMLLTGLLAILALYDDFKTWQEGGKSFFDWTKVAPYITGVLIPALNGVLDIVANLAKAFKDVWNSDWSALLHDLSNIKNAFVGISEAIDNLVKSFHIPIVDKVLAWRDRIDEAILGTKPSATLAPSLGAFAGALGTMNAQNPAATSPLLGGAGGGTHQRVQQETNITVNGTPDASATGKAVANEQGKVNFDLVRNLKPVTQ